MARGATPSPPSPSLPYLYLPSMAAVPTLSLLLLLPFLIPVLPASTDCSTQLSIIAPCLTYVESGNHQTPNKDCCDGVRTFVAKDASCLCQLVQAGSSGTGLNINATRAAQLPALCNVKTNIAISNCTTSTTPSAGKTPPSSTPTTPKSASPSNSGNGHIIVPSPSVATAVSLAVLLCSVTYAWI